MTASGSWKKLVQKLYFLLMTHLTILRVCCSLTFNFNFHNPLQIIMSGLMESNGSSSQLTEQNQSWKQELEES